MPIGIAVVRREYKLFFDVEKADGRILRYHISPDPPCPKCGAKGCKDGVINGKVNDWYRACQNEKCGHEFCLIEEIRKGGK